MMSRDRVGDSFRHRKLTGIGLCLLFAVGCVPADPTPSGGSGAGGASGGGRASITTVTATCNELELVAPPVELTYDAAEAPAATGGEILDGEYFITAQTIYETTSGITLRPRRTNVTLEGDVWQEVSGAPEASSANPDQHDTFTLSLSGTAFELTSGCPGDGLTKSAEYTVDDAGFTVYLTYMGKTIGTVFTKQ
jgi:hypothetical protein